ncbi:hypothetical protein [Paenibacillus chungangensis]|uniref:Uncharacterized protein n=1 Tax=Paenibacillus chungangensis TaxID=696535 RepID=A0ABW3HLP6_9BACL
MKTKFTSILRKLELQDRTKATVSQ